MLKTLRQHRQDRFISQNDLAKLSGVTAATISRIENGVERPRFVTIRKLAKALNVDPGDIDFTQSTP